MPCTLLVNDNVLPECTPLVNVMWQISELGSGTVVAMFSGAPTGDPTGAAAGVIGGTYAQPTIDFDAYLPETAFTVTKTVTDSCANVSSFSDIYSNLPEADAVDDSGSDNAVNTPITGGGIAGNDSLCSFGVTSFAVIAGSEVGGTVTAFDPSTGVYDFMPTLNFVGVASFDYQILCDGVVIDTARVSIPYIVPTADAVNDDFGPYAVDDPAMINISPNDTPCSDSAVTTYTLSAGTEMGGTVTSINSSTGDVVFTPTAGFVGTASFTYNIMCNGVLVDSAVVNIVYQVAAPLADAVDDSAGPLAVDDPSVGDVSINDTACSAGVTTYAVNGGSEIGGVVTAFDNATGAYTFTPSSGFTGNAGFTYSILCDGVVQDTATVVIVYAPGNTPVIAGTTGGSSVPSGSASIDTTGSFGPFVRVGHDIGNTGAFDEQTPYVANTGTNVIGISGQLNDGDRIEVCTADDAAGTNEVCVTCIIVQTTGSITDGDDISNLEITYSIAQDVGATGVSTLFEFYDSSGVLVHSESRPFGTGVETFDLTAAPISATDCVEVRIISSNSTVCDEFDPAILDRCAGLTFPTIDPATIIDSFTDGATYMINLNP